MKTTIKTVKTLSLALLLGAFTACNNDNNANNTDRNERDPKEHAEDMNDNLDRETEKDADRMVKLHTANLFEIQASQTAMNKATTPEVKKLAKMMADAHTKMGAEMQSLAMQKNITLPADFSDGEKRDLDDLNDKTGLDFDKAYTDKMKDKHDDAIDKLEKIMDKTEDADVKQFASKSLPEIRSHRDMIESTKEQIKDRKDNSKNKRNNNS